MVPGHGCVLDIIAAAVPAATAASTAGAAHSAGRGYSPRTPERSYPTPRGYAAMPLVLSDPGVDRALAGELEILVRALAEAGLATRSG